MYKVMVATEEHIPWIRDVAATRMLKEEVYKPEYVNHTQIEHLIRQGIATNTMWIVLKNDVPVGALGALAVPSLFNPTIRTLMEIFWWVDPDHRTGRAGAMLLTTYVAEADNYDEATLTLLTTSNVMNETLLKKGFHLREFGFRKEG